MGSYKDTEARIKFPVICVYGESGAGKTTYAKTFDAIILDGDSVRKYITSDLGYSEEDRRKNNELIAKIAMLLYHQGQKVVISTVRADIAAKVLKVNNVPTEVYKINKKHKIKRV